MALDNAKLVSTVAMLVQHLAEKKYEELAVLTDTIRMRSDEIMEAVESYPGSILLTVRPQDIDTIKIETAKEDCWSVNVRLHTDREGPSDLTMSLTLFESNTEFYGVELEDIHVL
jgi:hypothetical protein